MYTEQNPMRHGILIAILTLALVAPGRAETITAARDQLITGIVVASAVIAGVVIFVVVHGKHKKEAITGCVASLPNGMSLSDEKDKRTWALSGDSAGARAGERMTLAGKRKNVNNMPVFEVLSVTKDLGACQP
jgi:hypothetical protein